MIHHVTPAARSTRRRAGRRRSVAVVLATSLVLAGCGSDDGDADGGGGEGSVATEVTDDAPSTTDDAPEEPEPDDTETDPEPETETETETETEPDEPDELGEPGDLIQADDPIAFLTSPAAIRTSGALSLADEAEPGRYRTHNGAAAVDACSVRAGLVALYVGGSDEPLGAFDGSLFAASGVESELNQDVTGLVADAGLSVGVTYALVPSGEELAISAQLIQIGVLASPVYEMFPSPGRMYFPGTLPVPLAEMTDAPTASGVIAGADGIRVSVIDTGGFDGLGNLAPVAIASSSDVDLVGDPRPVTDNNLVVGHGGFVSGVIAQHGPAETVHLRVPVQTDDSNTPVESVRFDETDFMVAALAAGDSRLINLSAGFGACTHDGIELVPVTALSALANHIVSEEQTLVAAAGNAGGMERPAYPAAFADPTIAASVAVGNEECDAVFESRVCSDPRVQRALEAATELASLVDDPGIAADDQEPTSESETAPGADAEPETEPDVETEPDASPPDRFPNVIAVGANDEVSGERYSTVGDWITTLAPGCHVSWYPAGDVVYPVDRGDGMPLALEFPGDGNGVSEAFWCGSSFATAVITGELAAYLADRANDTVSVEDLKSYAQGLG